MTLRQTGGGREIIQPHFTPRNCPVCHQESLSVCSTISASLETHNRSHHVNGQELLSQLEPFFCFIVDRFSNYKSAGLLSPGRETVKSNTEGPGALWSSRAPPMVTSSILKWGVVADVYDLWTLLVMCCGLAAALCCLRVNARGSELVHKKDFNHRTSTWPGPQHHKCFPGCQ